VPWVRCDVVSVAGCYISHVASCTAHVARGAETRASRSRCSSARVFLTATTCSGALSLARQEALGSPAQRSAARAAPGLAGRAHRLSGARCTSPRTPAARQRMRQRATGRGRLPRTARSCARAPSAATRPPSRRAGPASAPVGTDGLVGAARRGAALRRPIARGQ
jgi:hypothetical protein